MIGKDGDIFTTFQACSCGIVIWLASAMDLQLSVADTSYTLQVFWRQRVPEVGKLAQKPERLLSIKSQFVPIP